jgi:hypothetical protein
MCVCMYICVPFGVSECTLEDSYFIFRAFMSCVGSVYAVVGLDTSD